ncbi:hypothetical protein AMAG_14924 [Allomyces macrogynus ATCC 38327]|uniref:TLC domain-containing protein n=1 Tax=Allomyces macrogynus (strain ATCC 38327) TaxID=578462 RepID=A0A0L0T7M1_ALLM3|nr:hypothetical protein AMAG_14924 [Allomyces macrogynus ATCC 38327]|eukprot:KNE70808.1 hypothetical protein AMAG_14924 [Allomyces macrogynus ATCC 38327]
MSMSKPIADAAASAASVAASGDGGTVRTVMLNLAAYAAAHVVLDRVWQKCLGQAKYKALSRRDRIYLAEKILSSVNALVTSGLAFKAIFLDKAYDGDVLNPYPNLAHTVFASMCGYTIYDLFTMWAQGGDHWSMWIHHIMSLYGTSLIMYFRKPSFFPLLFAVSEITALANNLVWYAQTLRPTSSWLPSLMVARAVTFTVARAWIAPYALARALAQAQYNPAMLWAQWFGASSNLARIAAFLTALNVFTIGWFNVGWTTAVWKLAVRALRGVPLRKAKRA